ALPIVALLTFDEGAETLAGVTAKEAADPLSDFDLAAIGANHGAGLLAALTALEEMRGDGRVLAALPNIGLASLSGGRVLYPHATHAYFAQVAAHARELRVPPARTPRLLRRVRRARPRAGRPGDRRLLRHPARRDRRHPGCD